MPQKIDELLKHNLKLTAEGSDEAFSKILKMYSPLINSLVAKYSSMGDLDSNDEEDMYQEAVLSLYKAAITYKPEIENVTFGLYARICISRRLISLLRHINIHKNRRICSVDEIDNALYSQYSDPALPLLNKESLSRLDEIIENHLSAYEKKIFTSYIDGMNASDIAKSVGKSEKSVYNAICRIKAKVRKLL